MGLAFDLHKGLIHMPLVTRPWTPTTELIGILLTKLTAPLADRLIRDHAAFQQELFYITEAQAEAKIQPHGVADDRCGKTMVLIGNGWGYGAQAATVSHRLGVKQVVNAGADKGGQGSSEPARHKAGPQAEAFAATGHPCAETH